MSASTITTTVSPLLQTERNRYVLYPIVYKEVFDFYKKAVASFWTPEEIDISKDIKDFEALSPEDKHFIKWVLAFFAASDGIVNDNLAARFMHEIEMPEARAFYGFQIAMETIHGETYSLLLDTYVSDTSEKLQLFDAIKTIPSVKRKADWAVKWIDSKEAPFAQRLLAFACVEGIFFSASFCAIYWYKERLLMPGLCHSNDLISRDEGLHTEFAVFLYANYIPDKLDSEVVYAMIREAVEAESVFVNDAISKALVGMKPDKMLQYIQFCADRLLSQLGYDKLYNVDNPFSFMNRISIQGKTNFFENRVSEYNLATLVDRNLTLTADF